MNCIEFEAAVERAVETREPLALGMLEHASSCTDCRSLWELHQQLDAVIVAWRFATPRAGLADAVLAELTMPTLGNDHETIVNLNDGLRWRTRSSDLAMASVAVCLVAAVVFAAQFSGRDRGPRHHELTRAPEIRRMDQAVVDLPLDVSSTLTAVFSDLRSEYREIASETTSVAQEMVNAMPHRVSMSTLPAPNEIELHPNTSDMVRIWQPIGSRVESALGFLWQAIPSEVPSG